MHTAQFYPEDYSLAKYDFIDLYQYDAMMDSIFLFFLLLFFSMEDGYFVALYSRASFAVNFPLALLACDSCLSVYMPVLGYCKDI